MLYATAAAAATATVYGNGETATEERQRNGGKRALGISYCFPDFAACLPHVRMFANAEVRKQHQ